MLTENDQLVDDLAATFELGRADLHVVRPPTIHVIPNHSDTHDTFNLPIVQLFTACLFEGPHLWF